MICEVCGEIKDCAPVEGAVVCEACAPEFRQALDKARNSGAWGRARDAHFVARQLLRDRGGMSQMLIRDMPAPAYKAIKVLAIERGVTVRELVLSALAEYIQRHKK